MTDSQPLLTAVVAMDRNRLIGADNRLPWHLPADLAHFKRLTMGGCMLMGRKTFESIGRALPGRHSLVMTRDTDFEAPGCTVVHDLEQALAAAGPVEEIFVIGGADLFRHLLPLCRRMHLTVIEHEFEGDTFLAQLNETWQEVAREAHDADDKNPYPYTFLTLERRP
ncbi:dihydrofolate reductase [Ectothiorhodospira lacustris]|uniref:dihydrofolate reductase n=1 Tax=Ectothiorhodospira lacustris TaxID=2899127 RepID=UPI002378894B|nr:dihydrofolate reductase [Ectothiorhodospira lacustris]